MTPELKTADKAARTDKQPVLPGVNPMLRDVFKVSGFDRMLQIEPDLETAKAKHG